MSIEWDGTGLPPVGCECEVWCEDHADYEWVRIKVFAEYKGMIIGIVNMPTQIIHDEINKYAAGYNRAEFRPIRTESERKRDAAVAALKQLKPQLVGELAGYLYDDIAAGKIPGIRLTDDAGS